MSAPFGGMVDQAATEQDWNDSQLQAAIGLLPGRKSFHAKQVRRLREGKYRLVPREVVERLIEILDLDPYEAWPAAGQTPPGFNAEHLRRLDFFASRGRDAVAAGVGAGALTHRSVQHQGHVKGLGQLIPFPVGRRAAAARAAVV